MRRLHPILIVIVVGMVASASGHADTVLIATLTNDAGDPPPAPCPWFPRLPRAIPGRHHLAPPSSL